MGYEAKSFGQIKIWFFNIWLKKITAINQKLKISFKIGGIVIRQMNLQVGGMLKMIFVCHVIALVLMLSFLIQCPAREFVGITVGYAQQ